MSNKLDVLQRLKEKALRHLEKERQNKRIKELNRQIKELAIKSPSKEEVQLVQIKDLLLYAKEERPFFEYALKDPRLMKIKRKLDIFKQYKFGQATKLLLMTRQAKNRALIRDWYGAQEAFCYIRDAYQKLFKL